eukprot:scaffold9385_cov93-Skeletonema_marinoi.AAC.2
MSADATDSEMKLNVERKDVAMYLDCYVPLLLLQKMCHIHEVTLAQQSNCHISLQVSFALRSHNASCIMIYYDGYCTDR